PSALLSLSAATLIEYHMSLALSTAFLHFFPPCLFFREVDFYVITLPCDLSIVLSRIIKQNLQGSNRAALSNIIQKKRKKKSQLLKILFLHWQ
ncbi:MAG: hypothetical protein K2O06_03650, partial [Acetatifactor sp.]|nr:hypothetical protein [Acetatifactor sp.]